MNLQVQNKKRKVELQGKIRKQAFLTGAMYFLALLVVATLFCFACLISTRFPLSVQIRHRLRLNHFFDSLLSFALFTCKTV